MRTGPFKILVMSSALEFPHDSIPTCLKMLQDLGKATAPERAKITGLAADTTWTVDQMGSTPSAANYFSEVTADKSQELRVVLFQQPDRPGLHQCAERRSKEADLRGLLEQRRRVGGTAFRDRLREDNGGSWTWFHDNIDGG